MPAQTSRYFCIHGHFYQPPRENPLVDQIELQPSASPSHDWNERVFVECYAPNGASRILDDKGRIQDILNNYAYVSFNIGPTLFSWLEEHHPYTYSRILEADRLSCERLDGHGNALAQVYNHVIMPLATEEQKILQIKWGIADFERRFGRRPEGMWLAETAINMDTICCLIREGIKFTVLAPTQALKVRPLYGETWTDVSHNTIDPRRPYRIFPLAEDGTPVEKGYLDVFFYDGSLSHGVGFEHLLTNASHFGERIRQAFDSGGHEDQLVSVCTDGESYGHHEPFGDMCAAFLFQDVASRLDLVPVNYAWFLAKHASRFEVKLKNAYGEGTAWSCAHGVGRWKEDCGCSNGGQQGWNQKWRGPLRRALDLLYGEALKTVAEEGPRLFRDWPLARDTAIHAWGLDAGARKAWWDFHARPEADRARALAVVETLRFSPYIFTSCAWFFADLTGIEAVQNLKYALRVLQLLEGLGAPPSVRRDFLAAMAQAQSNFGERSGDRIFLDLERETWPLHAYLALGQWAGDFVGETFPYSETAVWKCIGRTQRVFGSESGDQILTVRENVFAHDITGERVTAWLAYREDGFDCDELAYAEGPQLSLAHWSPAGPLGPSAAEWLAPGRTLALPARALPLDIKDRMAVHLRQEFWLESEPEVRMQEMRLDMKQKQFQRLGWPLPRSILESLRIIENFRLVETLLVGMKKEDGEQLRRALEMAKVLRSQGILAHLGPAKRNLHHYLLLLGRRLMESPGKADLAPIFTLLDLVDTLKLNQERYRIENLAFPILKALNTWVQTGAFPLKFGPADAILLLDRLNFNTEAAKTYLVESRKAAKS